MIKNIWIRIILFFIAALSIGFSLQIVLEKPDNIYLNCIGLLLIGFLTGSAILNYLGYYLLGKEQ